MAERVAETPLHIHPDAVLAPTVAGQALQPVPWRNPQVLDILRRMDQLELPQGRPLYPSVDALDVLLMPDALGGLASRTICQRDQ